MLDIAIAIAVVLASIYAVASLVGTALLAHLVCNAIKIYRDQQYQKSFAEELDKAKRIAQGFQAYDEKIDTTKPAPKGFRQL